MTISAGISLRNHRIGTLDSYDMRSREFCRLVGNEGFDVEVEKICGLHGVFLDSLSWRV